MKKSKYSFAVDYADDILKDQNRVEKIKKTKKRKRFEEHIIALCELYNIPPQEFGKMVAKYSQFPISKEELDINKK